MAKKTKPQESKPEGSIPSAQELVDKGMGAIATKTSLDAMPGTQAVALKTPASMFGGDMSKLVIRRLTLPPIVKPLDVASNPEVAVIGTIRRIVNSPMAQFKSKLLVMDHASGKQFCFPATAVVVSALYKDLVERKVEGVTPGLTGEARESTLENCIGQTIIIKGLGTQLTQDKKRTVNLFEVFIAEPQTA